MKNDRITEKEELLIKKLKKAKRISDNSISELIAMNRRYCVVMHQGKMCIMEKATDHEGRVIHKPLTERDFKLRHRGEKVMLAHYTEEGKEWRAKALAPFWLAWSHRSIKECTVFDPRGLKNENAERFYPLWPGYAVEPEKGDCSLIVAHLKDIWCNKNEEHFRYLINWLAHMLQFPWEKPNVALVIKGGKAAGKTTVFEGILQPILGDLYSKITNQEQIVGKFNSHQVYKLLLVAEEGYWAGDKHAEGTLKSMITDKCTLVEPKGVDAYETYTYYRLAFVSNETRVVPATMDERRFFAIRVSDEKKMDANYFGPLWEQIENGGVAAFMDYLMEWKVDRKLVFNPPHTDVLTEDILENMPSFERWAFDFLHADEEDEFITWDASVHTANFFQHYEKWRKKSNELGVFVGKGEVGGVTKMTQEVKKLFGFTYRKVKGKQSFILPSRDAARKIFQDKINGKIVWRDIEVDDDGDFFDESIAKPESRGFDDLDDLLED
ncbi:conserved protein of unknown function [Pseudodesulfovibrio profundus]|uniref:NrS-1 polymerase-like helicase domain-containing protein n=1 Tax=Pseudodesulfovibrio profundus TaxID=57320 RepID=A0A2C8FBI0_9BACT|nr:primase-helicase family protein [Pseudodesulfovibrio profundus]SOB59851.1 conserved protein of unknown function [Pseudodesulfovibrio profundus]